jgi:hypothetical protein
MARKLIGEHYTLEELRKKTDKGNVNGSVLKVDQKYLRVWLTGRTVQIEELTEHGWRITDTYIAE